jgi:hypothetical protein
METVTTYPARTDSLQEYNAISETLQHYIDGSRAGNSELMRPAFHPDASVVGYVGDNLLLRLFRFCLTGLTKTVPPQTLSPK